MKLLSITTLAALTVTCITASSVIRARFNEAADLAREVELFQGDWQINEERIDYIFENTSSKFILNFIEQTKGSCFRILSNLHEKATKEIIEEVLEKIKFSDDVLSYAASSPKLACSPKEFISLLNRITTPKVQEHAVEKGIQTLFYNKRTECIEPLLTALEGEEFLHKNLHGLAIRSVFEHALCCHNIFVMEDVYDHPTITPVIYANALFKFLIPDPQCPVFGSLLSKADLGDLEVLDTIDDYHKYARRNPKFDSLIKKTKEVAKPAGTRLQGPLERVKMTYKVLLNELPGGSVPKVIIDIISSYVTKHVKVEVEGSKKKKRKERDEPEIVKQDEPKLAKKDKMKSKKKAKRARRKMKKLGGEKWGESFEDS